MTTRVLDALLSPLEELEREYEAAIGALHLVSGELRRLAARTRDEGGGAAQGAAPPESSAQPKPSSPRVEVEGGDLDQLLELQERLATVDGVLRVTVTGVNEGRAALLVEMERGATRQHPGAIAGGRRAEQPTVVCAWCGKIIVAGGAQTSDGLCAECVGPFISRSRGLRQ